MEERNQASLRLFSILWAVACLFHYQAFHKWEEGYFVAFAALWLLAKPSDWRRLMLLSTLQLVEAFWHLPLKNNHWILTSMVNLSILFAGIRAWGRPSEIYHLFSTPARILLLTLYFFAVFHKLNVDFLRLETSCGASFYRAFGFLPSSWTLEGLTVALTLGFETLIPIGLCMRKTRGWALAFAVFFHGIIAYNPMSEFWNFSSLMYALFSLFLSEDIALKLPRKVPVLWMGLACFAAISVQSVFFERLFGMALWTLFFLLSLYYLWKEQVAFRTYSLNWQWSFLLWIPVLAYLNGFSPYLGLKTEGAFAMFSNLRTEGSASNHLFIDSRYQLFGYQKDLVYIVESTDPNLRRMQELEQALPYFGFKQYMRQNPHGRTLYSRNGELLDSSLTKELYEKGNVFEESFLVFRPINLAGPVHCTR